MTEAIVSAVVKKLADLVVDEIHSLRGVDSKVNEVKVQLGQMQCFLKDAESTKKRGDERIKGWVRDVRNVAYEIEDVFDTFLVEANRRRFSLKLNRLLVRHTLNQKISKIQAKLGRISEGRNTFGIQDLSGDGDQSQSLLRTQPNSFKRRVLPDVDNSEFVGFEDEKGYIINLLLNGLSNQSRYVISIVGCGGLGKTTLAQKVYSCPNVRNHFNSCLWITISQDFNLLDVLKKIHQKLANETELKGESKEDQIVFLLEEVNKLLKKKKYLIVLDDVWTEHVFTQLETGLVDIRNGSRVLMTTRNLNVANYADSRGVYHLRLLSEEEGWVLFLKKAFRSSNPLPECPEELKDLARKLVKRCNGLPLAVTVLGGLLSSKPCTRREWSGVLERLDWHTVGQGECMKILASSYNDLSYQQKSCFRYLACFPEDYIIMAKELMYMWIAEGLIEAKNKEALEDYAEDYLEELVQRCLVQVVERSPDGAIKSIRVHDLLREVALGEAIENDFLLIWKNENAKGDASMTRRLAFHENIDESSSINQPKDLGKIKLPRLRTFISFKGNVFGTRFLLLRVLELRCAQTGYLPTDLKNMIHLRYLGMSKLKFIVIPSWIDHLQNLQTVYTYSGTIPESLWKIPCLRHVHCCSSNKIVGPPSTANLVNLRSLGWFLVPKSWEKSFPHLHGVRELQLIDNDENDGIVIHDLMSKLHNLLSVSFHNFYPPGGMIDFSTSPSYQNIHTMDLSGYISMNNHGYIRTVHIVEMSPNLAKVRLAYLHFNNDPMRKLEKLRGLKCLEMINITTKEDTIVCTNGGFPALQTLKLDKVGEVKEWKVEYGALPMLKYLHIAHFYNLRTFPDLQCVTTLQELKLGRDLYPKIKDKSGEEWDKVKNIPTIIEYNS